MSLEQDVTNAEILSLIKSLTAVVQEQSQEMNAATNQIKQLADTVENLSKVTPTQTHALAASRGPRLRHPNLVLTEFTSRVSLDRS